MVIDAGRKRQIEHLKVYVCPKADSCEKLKMVEDHDLPNYGQVMRDICDACQQKAYWADISDRAGQVPPDFLY